jgi:FMN phosphatase YigB (HAD superfamily)
MTLSGKVILVDADGVLLDWLHMFSNWMNQNGYILLAEDEYHIDKAYNINKAKSKQLVRMFNESARIKYIPPFKDAIKYVKKLHEEHGYVFHCITSLSKDPYAQELRTENLTRLFGPTIFEKIIYLDTGADKGDALQQYAGTECYFIEDKVENAVAGHNLGLNSILMEHGYNRAVAVDFPRVHNWKSIYGIIVGS